jgi:hypothetical protein
MTSNPFPANRATRQSAGEPRPVARDGERAASAIRAVHEMFEVSPNEEPTAWTKLEARRHRRSHLLPLLLLGATAAAGAIVVAVVPIVGSRHADVVPPGAAPIATAENRAPIKQPDPSPGALPAGRSVLPGGLRAHLRGGGRAVWFPTSAAGGHLVLERGTLEIDADAPVDVRVASLRVDGSAGRFEIATRGDAVDVTVDKGEAAVWSSVRLLTRVFAGERWSSEPRPPIRGSSTRGHRTERPAATPPDPPEAPSAPAAEGPDCLRLARDGVTGAAIACFEGQSAQPGLTGELALLELARIRRDVKGDLSGAERLLSEHRRRFPHSALSAEARTIHVELLLRLAKPAEALAEAERLTGAEAIFWRAASLAGLGRRDEARRAFDDYLLRDGIERRGEAKRRRAELDDQRQPSPR